MVNIIHKQCRESLWSRWRYFFIVSRLKKKLFEFSWLPADRSVKPSLAYRFSFYLCPLFNFYAPFYATTACCKCSTWMQKVFQLKSSRQWRSVVGRGRGGGVKLCLVEVCLNKRTTCLMWRQQQQQQQAASRATTTGGTDVHCFSFCFIIYFAFLHPPLPIKWTHAAPPSVTQF